VAYGIDEYGEDQAPPGYMGQAPPQVEQQQDPMRAMKRQRLLAALAAGLGNPNRGGGFLGGLTSGFSGAVGGAQQFDVVRGEQYRQQQRDEAQQRRDDEARQRWNATFGETVRHNKATEVERPTASRADPYESEISQLQARADFLEGNPDLKWMVPRHDPPTPAAPRNDKMVQVEGPDGKPMYVPESEAAGRHPARERSLIKGQERTALAFYNRAKEAEGNIAALEEKISKMSTPDQFRLRFAPNIMQSSDQQVYRQAQRAFTEARLRKESGAAIPTSEYDNDSKTYFAQPGDAPATIAKKRSARQKVLNGMKFQSGAAYEEYYGEPNTPPGRANTVEDLGAKYGF
jgi:hypothetical protein